MAVVTTGCRSSGSVVKDGQEPPINLGKGPAIRDRSATGFAEDRRRGREPGGMGRTEGDIIPVSASTPKSKAGSSDGPELTPPTPVEGTGARPLTPPAREPAVPRLEASPGGKEFPARPATVFPAGPANLGERPAPTVMGSVLQMPPNQSPIEKALELSAKVDALRQESAQLSLRLRALEDEVRARDQVLKGATGEVRAATTEISLTREQLRTWAADLKSQEARLRAQEQGQQEQLRAVIRMLEKATEADSPGVTAHQPR